MRLTGATRLTWRRVLRSGPTTRLVLVLVLGAAAGAGMAAVAGGRRAATSFDRLAAWSHASDVSAAHVSNFGLREAPNRSAPDLLAQVSALPEIAADAMWMEFRGRATLADGTELEFPSDSLHVVTPEQSAATGELDRSKVVRGRLPATDAVDEVAVPLYTAQRLDLDVGDSLAIDLTDADGREVAAQTVEVTGVTVGARSLPSMSGRVLVSELDASPALAAAHPAGIEPSWQMMSARLRDGVGIEELRAALDAAGLGDDIVLFGFESGYRSGVRHIVRLEAQALWVAAGVIVIVGLVVATQLMLRTGRTADADLATVRALGMSARDVAWAGAGGGAEVGLGASVLGVVLAVALSPLLPVGLARIADPSPGVHADLTTLAVGVLVTLSAAVVIGALAAFRAARVPAAAPTDPRSRLSRLGRLLPPPLATGMRMVVAPAVRGGGGGWRAFAGIATVAASFVGILGLNASFRHLLANPQLSGATWEAAVFYYESIAEAREGAAIIERVPEVDAVARGAWFETTVDGHLVYTLAQEVTPALRPAITSGRLPREVDEIVVGERILAALDLELGERAVMAFPGVKSELPDATPQTVRVVGTVVLSSPVFGNVGPGEGALISLDLARRWEPDIGEWAGFLLRFAPGIGAEDGLAAVSAAAAPDQGFTNQNRGDISMLRDVEQVPRAVAGMLAVLTAITLVHHLFATTRAHRREVAALRTLGLTRAQLLAAGAVQGATVAAATLVVAVPLGVLLSRLGWQRLADYLIVVPDTPALIGVLFVVACALLVGAVVAGTVIVRSSCRASPGATLRAP